MCRECTADLRELLEETDRFQNHNRTVVEIEDVDEDDVRLAGESGVAFHLSHVGELLHWLRDEHFVCGVSSGTTAIKTLLGEGKLASCNTCASSASQIWAIVHAMPEVQRDGTSGLAPNPQGR
jgi:hypothetical protein